MSLLWAANAARRKKAGYVAGSSRWVSNELNNQFMDSFHLIEEFYESVCSDHDVLSSTMDDIYLGVFNPDTISSTKSPAKKLTPQSASRPKVLPLPKPDVKKLEPVELLPREGSHVAVSPVKPSVTVAAATASHAVVAPKDEKRLLEPKEERTFRFSDGSEDSFQAISKSIRKSIAERTTGATVDKRDAVSPPVSSRTNQTFKTESSTAISKKADKLTISKRGRSSMFVALPPREPIVINSSSRSRKSTLKPRTTGNLPKVERPPKDISPVKPSLSLATVSNEADLLDKFRISPVEVPKDRKFLYDTPQYTSMKLDFRVDGNVSNEKDSANGDNRGPIASAADSEDARLNSANAAPSLNTPSKSPTEELLAVDRICDKIGKYRSLSPVKKLPPNVLGTRKSLSRSRSRSRSRSPIRRERARTTTISGSPSRPGTILRRSRSPTRKAIIGGDDEAVLVNRLTAPTSSSAAKTKLQNRKTADGKKVERNRFLTATLIPTVSDKNGGASKSKDGSPTRAKNETSKFPRFEAGDIPKLKLPVMEKRTESVKTKYIIKPLNRKSELAKVKAQTELAIIGPDHGNPGQHDETNLATTHTEESKSERRNKRVKTANGVALPDAARGVLNKENANKKHLHQTPTKPTTKKYGDILPATPAQISPGSLPAILSDDDISAADKKVLQSWAHTPVLRRTIMNNRAIDPTTVFKSNPKIDLKETFENDESVKRGQQSPGPTPNPRQREKEAKRYTLQMGYIP
ncbi:hypothetical protein Cantr_08685 [Candida viswanathii]|uniref:Inner centromere protein ARK-binding domain-containing protein n=1 Tax=Candida viswanathii TaxID=5486 RepID=A0A367Y5Z9_9ASCO|nr:hypothetical protein Cantr_08685 [Candida viswanathii]